MPISRRTSIQVHGNVDPGFEPVRYAFEQNLAERAAEEVNHGGLMRIPSFCAGCPHNTSTVVPEDSIALGGIGCHGMAVWTPGRRGGRRIAARAAACEVAARKG